MHRGLCFTHGMRSGTTTRVKYPLYTRLPSHRVPFPQGSLSGLGRNTHQHTPCLRKGPIPYLPTPKFPTYPQTVPVTSFLTVRFVTLTGYVLGFHYIIVYEFVDVTRFVQSTRPLCLLLLCLLWGREHYNSRIIHTTPLFVHLWTYLF